ncbi:MAG TPA: hypothetical protein VF657_25750 [Actinoplanes sp.]
MHRHSAADDGRGVLLELTDAGAAAAARQEEARRARFGALLERIPDEQRALVVQTLRLLVDASDEPL